MIEDQWDYITKDAIERTADYFGLTATDVFSFLPVEFWRPIEERGCVFVRGTRAETGRSPALVIPWYDDAATSLIKRFIRERLRDERIPGISDHFDNEEQLLRQVADNNCIVIGSPRTNTATEILLSRHFEAEPFDASETNRHKIPFGFCWPEDDPGVAASSLMCSASARANAKNTPGISINGKHVAADFLPREQYLQWETDEGKDCGLVFVANKSNRSGQVCRLIVLAGFSGIGTLGAAHALVDDFRYLEPIEQEDSVFGIVEVTFSKRANATDRRLRDVRWRFRSGGHSPIDTEKLAPTKTRRPARPTKRKK